jgi:hypothetical protein
MFPWPVCIRILFLTEVTLAKSVSNNSHDGETASTMWTRIFYHHTSYLPPLHVKDFSESIATNKMFKYDYVRYSWCLFWKTYTYAISTR